MKSRSTGVRAIPYIFWVLAVGAIVIWSQVPSYVVGWDLDVYKHAVLALRAGHDPYADGIAVQEAFHQTLAQHPNAPTPFTYVYSPLTLPLLKAILGLPFTVSGTIYWMLYWAGLFTAIWVGTRAIEAKERWTFSLIAPAIVFFPGLIQNDVLFSGNVAYILYGLMLGAAWVGWRRGQWGWFYLAVLAASCCKAPLLTMLVIPVLSKPKQWVPAIATGAAGLGIFALEPHIWPTLFQHYLKAVELQFSYNHDFGSSPAGLVGGALYDRVPYQISTVGAYLLYAVPSLAVMIYLSRRFFEGRFTLGQWMPVLSVGAVLMNPRIMEYDVAPITMAMALIVWRFYSRGASLTKTIVLGGLTFAVANVCGVMQWRLTESVLLLGTFIAGCWHLYQVVRDAEAAPSMEMGGELAWEAIEAEAAPVR